MSLVNVVIVFIFMNNFFIYIRRVVGVGGILRECEGIRFVLIWELWFFFLVLGDIIRWRMFI